MTHTLPTEDCVLRHAQVVWDGFDSPPWRTVKEPELRAFLLERAAEGFSFPLNPVWPVRDKGWLEVLHALQRHDEGTVNLSAWFPPSSGVLERIQYLHAKYPEGFYRVKAKEGTEQAKHSPAMALAQAADCDTRDLANFAELEVRRETQARWQRIRGALKLFFLQHARSTHL